MKPFAGFTTPKAQNERKRGQPGANYLGERKTYMPRRQWRPWLKS